MLLLLLLLPEGIFSLTLTLTLSLSLCLTLSTGSNRRQPKPAQHQKGPTAKMMLRHVLRAGRSSALRRSSPLCLRLSPAASPSPAATAAIAPSFSSTSSASASTASRAGGQVYAWGRAKNGSVGLGPEVTDIVGLPNRVAVLAGEDIVRVRCFEDTSGALTAGGDLFLWGDNDAGKISPDGEKKFYPFKVRCGMEWNAVAWRGVA